MAACMFCMREIRDGARFCPFCGRDQSKQPLAHHLPPGTVVGRKYRVGAALGEGGFGITYAGFDEALLLRVAIKEFFPFGFVNRVSSVTAEVSCSGDAEKSSFFQKGRARFMEEARVLARFSGARGIVDVRDFFEENNTAYIVMEFVDGVTLKQYLKQHGKLSPEETLRLLTPVMESLELLHRENVIHRDISPDNIMIADGNVKLLDFGAARNVAGDRKTLSVLLKPGYAPEEQYRGKGQQGPWTDVYAMCATMYRCMTGVRPEEGPDRLFEDTLKAPSALGVEIDPGVERVLLKGLAVRAADRWQSMDELLAAFTRETSEQKAPKPRSSGSSDREALEKEIAARVEKEVAARVEKELAARVAQELAQRAAAGQPQPKQEQPQVPAAKPVVAAPPVPDATIAVQPRQTAAQQTPSFHFPQKQWEIITLGHYPQSRVTDRTLLTAMEKLPKNWISYRYYSGTGDLWSGKVRPGDYMQYADFVFGKDKYRTVRFTSFRPNKSSSKSTASKIFTDSEQDENGYVCNKEYYFRFDPLQWRVLDPELNLIFSVMIIDSQAYQNTVFLKHSEYWQNESMQVYANNYALSSIRRWLNNDFYNTAFSVREKAEIDSVPLDNKASKTEYSRYDSKSTQDKVFMLSYREIEPFAFNSTKNDTSLDADLTGFGTDYSKCQGLHISSFHKGSPYKGSSYWWLRSAGDNSGVVTGVGYNGLITSGYYVDYTHGGVRPALRLKGP